MEIKIRQETIADFPRIKEILKAAFADEPHSDQSEHILVEKLRICDAYIPDLALVAETEKEIVGHILLTHIHIKNEQQKFNALALAPVSVHPDFQENGIGIRLIRKAHEIAKTLGHQSIILIGHESYYPRFGYEPLDKFDIKLPFEVPPQNRMAKELKKDALKNVNGLVVYSKPFFGQGIWKRKIKNRGTSVFTFFQFLPWHFGCRRPAFQ